VHSQPNLGGSHLGTSRLLNKVEHSLFQQFCCSSNFGSNGFGSCGAWNKASAIERTLVRYVVSGGAVFGLNVKGQATSRWPCVTFSPSWKRGRGDGFGRTATYRASNHSHLEHWQMVVERKLQASSIIPHNGLVLVGDGSKGSFLA
jgi:hypothetical protein